MSSKAEPKRRGRPPKKSPAKAPTKAPIKKPALGSPGLDSGANDILSRIGSAPPEEINSSGNGAPPAPEPISSKESPDAIAAAKIREASGSSRVDPKIDAMKKELEEEVAFVKDLLPMINARLRASKSIWAAEDKELERLAFLADKMIEKYFPSLDQYALEFCFSATVLAYAFPRVMQLRAQRSEISPAPAVVIPPGSTEPAKPIPRDDRLDGL